MLEPIDEAAVEASELPREVTEYEKKLRREVARYREQARIAVGERESACAAAVRDRDEKVAAVQADADGRVMQAELKTHAIRSGIVDLDGLRLADCVGLSVNEAGEVQGAEQVIASLRQHKPYLFAVDRTSMATATTAQLQRPPSPAQPSTVDARSLSREAWHTERDRLLSAPR
ncbi:MAG: hypothetical protein ACRYGI_08480 [Janthinobacterium lividum]